MLISANLWIVLPSSLCLCAHSFLVILDSNSIRQLSNLYARGGDGVEAAGGQTSVAREEAVDALVIGLPLTLGGAEGHQAERVRRFATASEKLGLPVRLYDERHTSTEAELRGARDLDAGAATILLEDFLAQRAR